MAQQNEEHFEVITKNKSKAYEEQKTMRQELIDSNKDAMLQRNKLKYLEDRISVLEKSLSALNKVVGELQAVEYERDINAK